jgi:hypothetical protein
MSYGDQPDVALGAEEPELAELLCHNRPIPGAGFRGSLGRRLAATDPGFGPRPERLWLLVTAWLAGGSLLIALGALSAAGTL